MMRKRGCLPLDRDVNLSRFGSSRTSKHLAHVSPTEEYAEEIPEDPGGRVNTAFEVVILPRSGCKPVLSLGVASVP
jgi:hypothetical protein